MKKLSQIFLLIVTGIIITGCQNSPQPAIVPAVSVKAITHNQNIIGEIEPMYFPPMKAPFQSRIDTGAETSSIDAQNVKYFERDGEKWVAFTLNNRQTGETHRFEKAIVRYINIKRIHLTEKRPLVTMDVKFGSEKFTALFSLAHRQRFEYQSLVGRNILSGRAIVDTSLSNTLN